MMTLNLICLDGEDYMGTCDEIIFECGSLKGDKKCCNITIMDDSLVEKVDEKFFVNAHVNPIDHDEWNWRDCASTSTSSTSSTFSIAPTSSEDSQMDTTINEPTLPSETRIIQLTGTGSIRPTESDTTRPAIQPTESDTTRPTTQPTESDTTRPTTQPTESDTTRPATQPTKSDTTRPVIQPTATQPAKSDTTWSTTQSTDTDSNRPIQTGSTTQPTETGVTKPTTPPSDNNRPTDMNVTRPTLPPENTNKTVPPILSIPTEEHPTTNNNERSLSEPATVQFGGTMNDHGRVPVIIIDNDGMFSLSQCLLV